MARVQRIDRQVVVEGGPRVVYDEGIFQTAQVIDYVLGVVEVALALRFVLQLFGANVGNWFVSAVYALTAPLMAPFRAVFNTTNTQGATFEWSVLVAMVVYALVALAIIRLIEVVGERRYAH